MSTIPFPYFRVKRPRPAAGIRRIKGLSYGKPRVLRFKGITPRTGKHPLRKYFRNGRKPVVRKYTGPPVATYAAPPPSWRVRQPEISKQTLLLVGAGALALTMLL